MRIVLIAAGLAVAVLLALLLAVARPGAGPKGGGGAEATGEGASEAGQGGVRPQRLTAGADPGAGIDDEVLPRITTPIEHQRPPNLAPHILDHTAPVAPLRAARDAFEDGDYPVALERAEEALALDPQRQRARILAVLAACSMTLPRRAQEHADQLDDARYNRVRERCKSLGVELQGGRPEVDEDEDDISGPSRVRLNPPD